MHDGFKECRPSPELDHRRTETEKHRKDYLKEQLSGDWVLHRDNVRPKRSRVARDSAESIGHVLASCFEFNALSFQVNTCLLGGFSDQACVNRRLKRTAHVLPLRVRCRRVLASSFGVVNPPLLAVRLYMAERGDNRPFACPSQLRYVSFAADRPPDPLLVFEDATIP